MAPAGAQGASSADELVRQARAHEAAHEEDLALRRYSEALALEPTNEQAWTGLGELRMKLGEAGEAERVYATALEHVPSLHLALEGRALARWALGRRSEAEADLEAYAASEQDPAAYRLLADWFGTDGRTPAQLAMWRHLLTMAARDPDSREFAYALRMVRALVILVDGADPAACPDDDDPTRRGLARIARRGR